MLRVVVISGAGLSVDSGIRPYRGADGIYTEMEEKYGCAPEELVTTLALRKQTDLFWTFWESKMLMFKDVQPCDAHKHLVEIEAKTNFLEVTQNVDGLSRAAGMPDNALVELHGSAHSYRCDRCGIAHQLYIREGMGTQRCYRCGDPAHAPIRPNVVLFGEMIKTAHYNKAYTAAKGADILITVGTTLQFGYLMDFVHAAIDAGAKTINIDPTAEPSAYYDVTLPMTASEGLGIVNSCIEKTMNGREEFMVQLRQKWNTNVS